MRVALLVSATLVNGVAKHCAILARYLRDRGHSVLLVQRRDSWLRHQTDLDGIERLDTTFRRRPSDLRAFRDGIRAFRPDVLHTHMSSAHSYGAASYLFDTLPVVATAHVSKIQLHWCLNRIVMTASQTAADFHVRFNRVNAKAIRVIPNFIEIEKINLPGESERQARRAELGIPSDAFVVGSVGHLSRYKRPADLVRAFAPLARAARQNRLLLVGAAMDAFEETKRVCAELKIADQVIFAGQRNNAVELLAAMDVFALASSRETGPLAILEAMASGLPVIATRIGMIPDFIREDRTGYLVDVGDHATISALLAKLAADPALRREIGINARAHVAANYTATIVCPRIEEALREAVAAGPHKPPLGWFARLPWFA